MIASIIRRVVWRAVLRLTGGLTVTGAAPGGPCVLVANHSSHADTAALLAAVPARRRPVVVAAADYWFGSRFRAVVCRLLTAGYPVRRTGGGSLDLIQVAGLLARGHTVIVYPEGTRSREGTLGRFHQGPARLAGLAGAPILPVALTGTRELLAVGGRLRRAHVTVRFGRPVNDLGAARRQITEVLS